MAVTKKLETIFLHIGMEKTGTTTIQSFLEHNLAELARRGYFFPRSIGLGNHMHLAAYALNCGSRDIAVTLSGLAEGEQALETFRHDLNERLAAEISETSATIGLFTSEDMSRLFNTEEVDRLLQLLFTLCNNVKIIVFVRRQDLMAISRYYSLILGGSTLRSIFSSHKERIYDYYGTLSTWARSVGPQNLKLIAYPERPSITNFDSVSAYCNAVGINDEGLIRVKKKNISLDSVNQIILRNFNAKIGRYDQASVEKVIEILAEFNDDRIGYIPSESQAVEFYNLFKEDNRKLFDELAPGSPAFGDDFSMYPQRNMRDEYQDVALQRLLRFLPYGFA